MSWVSFRVLPSHEREAALAALFAAGAQGVQEDGLALVTHFPPEADVQGIAARVRDADPGADVAIGRTPDTDWSEMWKSLLSVQQVGALRIAPPWLADGSDVAATVVIDPGMAFGTGDHATTRSVTRLMQRLPLAGARVADLGAGSAVLSIAAAKLGARIVTAIELDADAIGNATENVERNGVSNVVHVVEGDARLLLPFVAPVDVVLANIQSSVHVELLPVMREALASDGKAIVSGMLSDERDTMLASLIATGWVVDDEDVEDVWWSATVSPR